jgi:hypothetical protein
VRVGVVEVFWNHILRVIVELNLRLATLAFIKVVSTQIRCQSSPHSHVLVDRDWATNHALVRYWRLPRILLKEGLSATS